MAQEAQHIEVSSISDCGKLDKNMTQFVMNERFSDIKFLIRDKEICAHKVVLAARSDYFDSMLSDSKEISIDVPLRAFEEVLKYIYLGTMSIPSDEDMLVDILNLAHKFSLESLETFVTEKMSAFINCLNVCQRLNTTTLFNLRELREKCLHFVDENIAEILKNDTFCSLSQASMVALLERDDFPLPEIEVFKVVERWCKVNTDKDSLVKDCVRLTCLTEIEILKDVWASKLIEETKLLAALLKIKESGYKTDQQRTSFRQQSVSMIIKGTFEIPEVLKNLGLSQENLTQDLNSALTAKLNAAIKVENVCALLNAANSCALLDLKTNCHRFIDHNFTEVSTNGNFQQLTRVRESLTGLLKRDDCVVYETDLFKFAENWCKRNNNFDEAVIECIRFSLMSVTEILSFVWPTNLLKAEKLLHFISEIVGVKIKSSEPRIVSTVVDENVASDNRGARVIAGEKTSLLLTGTTVMDYCAYHVIKDNKNIIVKLDRQYWLNHIKMCLYEKDERFYSYHIEVSSDCEKWVKVIDHDRFPCRSYQHLYFDKRRVRYIKIIGTKCSKGSNFELSSFEAFLKSNIPSIINGIIRPRCNVATSENGALCIEGYNPQCILIRQLLVPYTWHLLGQGSIVIQLAQPYLVSSVKLFVRYAYKYRIETSINKIHWETVVDETDYKGQLQEHTFSERPAIFIRIVGTSCQDPFVNDFMCSNFKCWSKTGIQPDVYTP